MGATFAISLLIAVLVLALCIWVVQNWVPLDQRPKQIIIAIVVLAFVLWLLRALGIF